MGDISLYFSRSEIECHCGCGHFLLNKILLGQLELVRHATGFKMIINSWCRCLPHNISIGSKKTSSHPTGEAVDISYSSLEQLLKYIFWLTYFGFRRIKIYSSWIHVDISKLKLNPYYHIGEGVL